MNIITTKSSENRHTTTGIVLESGTSLAEQEHDGVAAPRIQRQMNVSSTVDTIDTLREEIAADVVNDSGKKSLFLFASPFEAPSGSVPLNKNKSAEEKFLQVPMIYTDHTASNRPLQSIENYVQETCLPYYANTHTNTSLTGAQSTAFVAEARQIVAEETNARITGKAALDVVLFAGSGTTAAVELLIDCLGLKHACSDVDNRPVVFVGPYEHHSNLIPWRESGCEIVAVPECTKTIGVDFDALEKMLQDPLYDNRLKMGTFTAASNVTGKVSDVDRIAATLHRHGALAFFDYATGAPYMSMNMNPLPSERYASASMVAKDAIFLSPHKMIGGVGTPGVLVVKKNLVNQENAPSRSGGGTVFYVSNTHHRFLSNRVDRYEGGTPNVPGILRVGLAFLYKRRIEQKFKLAAAESRNVDTDKERILTTQRIPTTLQYHEYNTFPRVANYLRVNAPNLCLLDADVNTQNESNNLPIFSFLIKCGKRFLHFNYVCAILNDVFGIQSRGGCQCAGPYSQRLLGLTKQTAAGEEVPNDDNQAIEHALLHHKERAELLRPGYTRLSLPFKGLRSNEMEYVLKALVWTSHNGWALMCNYRCNHRTGEWRHANRQGKPLGRTERKWLSHFDIPNTKHTNLSSECTTDESPDVGKCLQEALRNADCLLQTVVKDQRSIVQAFKMNESVGDDALERLRWYVHPKEVASFLSEGLNKVPQTDEPVLVGGLKPLPYYTACIKSSNDSQSSSDVKMTEETSQPSNGESLKNRDRKRKQQATPPSVSIPENDNSSTEEGAINVERFYFRDVEHSGEASIMEIENGYEEEELSPLCRIYDQRSGEWISIKAFLSEIKKKEPPGSTMKPVTEKLCSAPALEKRNTDSANLDMKNEQKKPSRACVSWGQGSFVQPKIKSISADDKINGRVFSEMKGNKDTTTQGVTKAKKKFKHVKPPPKLMRHITQAIIQWEMLKEGDRLLLGLSGGKDSLSLLHCLLECKRRLPIKFDIEVCTIDPMTPSFDPSPLIPYVESLGLKYHYIRDDIVSRANNSGKDGSTVSSLCAYCARMKRGNLYTCARENNCNKLVLAQHLDDCAESFLMSVMHNGFLRTMKANYTIDAGDLVVIRPMVYCRESLMTAFAKSASLPVINENCPACFEEPKERARVKKLLSREESLYPHFYDNMRRSLIPLMHDDMSSILRAFTEDAVSKSRKEPTAKNGRKRQRKSNTGTDVLNAQDTATNETYNPQQIGKHAPTNNMLATAGDEELLMELARRKASRYMQATQKSDDPTGQVCSLNGGDGIIPCSELME